MNYRNGTPEDALAVARINVETWQTCFRGLVPQPFLDAMDATKRSGSMANRFTKPNYGLVVAENAPGDIIGFCDFGPPRDSRWSCDTELYSIYVKVGFQKQGIGKELFKRITARIRSQGGRSLYVEVLEVSPFRSFYEKNDARIVGREDLEIEGQTFKLLVYAWDHLDS